MDNDATLKDGLAQRRRETLQRCADEAAAMQTPLLFGMTTSLALQSVPMPGHCDLDADALHTTASTHAKRVRSAGSTPHVWKPYTGDAGVLVQRGVFALDLFHTWAQLSSHVPLADLVMLGDAIIMAKAGDDADATYQQLIDFVHAMPYFRGKTACLNALPLIRPNVRSPKETESRLAATTHGIPCPVANHTVPGVAFASGATMTLDLAWPEYQVAVEYDGDQHRTDKQQWRRDKDKREQLQSRGWIIMTITALTLADEMARAEFAFRLARHLTARGARFEFLVVAMSLEELAARVASPLRAKSRSSQKEPREHGGRATQGDAGGEGRESRDESTA